MQQNDITTKYVRNKKREKLVKCDAIYMEKVKCTKEIKKNTGME